MYIGCHLLVSKIHGSPSEIAMLFVKNFGFKMQPSFMRYLIFLSSLLQHTPLIDTYYLKELELDSGDLTFEMIRLTKLLDGSSRHFTPTKSKSQKISITPLPLIGDFHIEIFQEKNHSFVKYLQYTYNTMFFTKKDREVNIQHLIQWNQCDFIIGEKSQNTKSIIRLNLNLQSICIKETMQYQSLLHGLFSSMTGTPMQEQSTPSLSPMFSPGKQERREVVKHSRLNHVPALHKLRYNLVIKDLTNVGRSQLTDKKRKDIVLEATPPKFQKIDHVVPVDEPVKRVLFAEIQAPQPPNMPMPPPMFSLNLPPPPPLGTQKAVITSPRKKKIHCKEVKESQGSLWEQQENKPVVKMSFELNLKAVTQTPTKVSPRKSPNVQILPMNRSKNIELFLFKSKTDQSKLLKWIDEVNREEWLKLNHEQLEVITPSPEEVELYKNVPNENLSSPDKFIWELIRIPNYRLKIKSLINSIQSRIGFSHEIDEMTKKRDMIQRIMTSKQFAQLLHMILQAVNDLNDDSIRGFQLNILTTLSKTKIGQSNMMERITCHAKEIGIADFHKELNLISTKTINEFEVDLKKVSQITEFFKMNPNDVFETEANENLSDFKKMFDQLKSEYKQLCKYLGQDMPDNEMFSCLETFVVEFKKYQDVKKK